MAKLDQDYNKDQPDISFNVPPQESASKELFYHRREDQDDRPIKVDFESVIQEEDQLMAEKQKGRWKSFIALAITLAVIITLSVSLSVVLAKSKRDESEIKQ